MARLAAASDPNARVRIVALTALQTELLERLRAAVLTTPIRQAVYRSEWLGYLPFGAYQWVEVGGRDISTSLPGDWRVADLEALAVAGLLTTVDEWQNPADQQEKRITYEVKLPPGDARWP